MAKASNRESIAQRVLRLCALKGWTLSELSRQSGVPRSTLGSLKDRNSPIIEGPTLLRLATALGVTLRYLQTGLGPMTSINPNDVEAEAVEICRHLSDERRAEWLELGHFMAGRRGPLNPKFPA